MNNPQNLPIRRLPPLGFKLSDIPEPTACPDCDGHTQREFVDFFVTGSTVLFRTTELPGYGCMVCGEKTLDPATTSAMFLVAEKLFRADGQTADADRCLLEAKIIQASLFV